jgi:hypothetical protein
VLVDIRGDGLPVAEKTELRQNPPPEPGGGIFFGI